MSSLLANDPVIGSARMTVSSNSNGRLWHFRCFFRYESMKSVAESTRLGYSHCCSRRNTMLSRIICGDLLLTTVKLQFTTKEPTAGFLSSSSSFMVQHLTTQADSVLRRQRQSVTANTLVKVKASSHEQDAMQRLGAKSTCERVSHEMAIQTMDFRLAWAMFVTFDLGTVFRPPPLRVLRSLGRALRHPDDLIPSVLSSGRMFVDPQVLFGINTSELVVPVNGQVCR